MRHPRRNYKRGPDLPDEIILGRQMSHKKLFQAKAPHMNFLRGGASQMKLSWERGSHNHFLRGRRFPDEIITGSDGEFKS